MKDEGWIKYIQELANSATAELKIIRCYCNEEELKKRIILREEERDNWKLNNWDEFMKNKPINVVIPLSHKDVDTTLSIDQQVNQAVSYILDDHAD